MAHCTRYNVEEIMLAFSILSFFPVEYYKIDVNFLFLSLIKGSFLYFQNVIWSFGLNRNIPVLNLTDHSRKLIMYACAHVGVLYDFENNRQHILQGHVSIILVNW